MKLAHTLCASLAVSALLLAQAGTALADTTTPAATSKTATHKKKIVHKKKETGTKAVPEEATGGPDDGGDEGTPDVSHVAPLEYSCELGNKLTIYHIPSDPNHIALRWGKTLHRLTKVDTSTGAHRFENKKYGLVWIGIPSKGMLLDSRNGHQLANECESSEERAAPGGKAVSN